MTRTGGREPGVGVVVPTWNEARRLPALLDALTACRPAPAEIVVADAGSTDGTLELAAGRVRVVASRRGRAHQQNVGARAVAAEIVWFLHADSPPPADGIARIRDAVAGGAVGGCFLVAFPDEERRAHPSLRLVAAGINARTRMTGRGTGDQGIFARRDAFDRVGGFPAWPLFEDVALFAALAGSGRTVVLAGPLVTSGRRWIEGGVVRTTLRMWALRAGYGIGIDPGRLARWWNAVPAP